MEIYDDTTLAAAVAAITDDTLLGMIERIVHDAKASGLWELICIIVADPADNGDQLQEMLGFDPLRGPLNDDTHEFVPYWSWLERHGHWYEMLITSGDTGYATFLLIPDAGAGLAALCRGQGGDMET